MKSLRVLLQSVVVFFVLSGALANENEIVKTVADFDDVDAAVPRYSQDAWVQNGENQLPQEEIEQLRTELSGNADVINGLTPSNYGIISRWNPFRIVQYIKEIVTSELNRLIDLPFRVGFAMVDKSCSIFSRLRKYIHEEAPRKERMNLIIKDHANQEYRIPLTNATDLLNHKEFNPEWDLVILVTGWTTNHNSIFGDFMNIALNIMSRAYKNKHVNFVTLDSARFISGLYSWSAFNTERVGEMLGEALKDMVDAGYPMSKIHLIGHSLGAHIAGSAGQYIRDQTGLLLPRITGLDPANPCFTTGNGLSKNDAAFVDVIHSNPGILGKPVPTGDVDFFPDGLNSLPPKCMGMICAHHYSVELYAESVRLGDENAFTAVKCRDTYLFRLLINSRVCSEERGTALMGFNTPNTTRGIFYIKTKGHNRHIYG